MSLILLLSYEPNKNYLIKFSFNEKIRFKELTLELLNFDVNTATQKMIYGD